MEYYRTTLEAINVAHRCTHLNDLLSQSELYYQLNSIAYCKVIQFLFIEFKIVIRLKT